MKNCSLTALFAVVLAFAGMPVWAQLGDDTPDFDKRVADVLRGLDIDYSIDKDGDFIVTRDVGSAGRTQLAYVMSSTSEYRNLEVREIWSVGYRSRTNVFPAEVANALLEDTMAKKLGAWAKLENQAIYVVKLSANADEESLYSALKMALEAADEFEEQLTGDIDEF